MPAPQAAVIAQLNARFRNGRPANALEAAGVLLRQFDNEEDYSAPWRGCPRGQKVREGAGNECAIYGGRFSSSIVNAAMVGAGGKGKIALFSQDSGVVFNPLGTQLNCIYAADGGTRKMPDDGCGPTSGFCPKTRSPHDGWCDGRPIFPDRVADALNGQGARPYNEAVVNTKYLDEHLPQAVEAFFFIAGARAYQRGKGEAAHAKFHAAYPTLAATEAPLLCLDPTDLERPFRSSDCLHH